MPITPNAGEDKEQFVSRCIGEEITAGYEPSMAAAICYSKWDRRELSKQKFGDAQSKVAAKINFDRKYEGINLTVLAEDSMENPCWSGFEPIGTKILDGREVPACVPIKE